MKTPLFLYAVLLSLAGCKSTPATTSAEEIQGIDSSIKPGKNFFMYVNHTWYDSAQIPPSQSGVGAYMFMNYPQRLRLQGILDSVSKANNATGSIEQQLGNFYASGMDTTTINQRGYEPVKPVLAVIDSISDLTALMKFVANAATSNNTSFLAFGIGPDNKNSNLNIAHIYQAGIGLPERDYYFKTDSPSIAIQQAYKIYLARLFQLTGNDTATASKNAGIVYNIDKQLASSHRTNIELRDVNANYNKMAVATLEKRQPAIGWRNVLKNLGAKTDSIDVAQPAYYEKLNAGLKSIPISDWKIYLKAYSISNYADVLSEPFVNASFELNKVISGQAVQKTRGEKMASAVDQLLGEALGQLYVKKYFTEEAKKRVLDLVNNLQKALAVRMDKLDWMSDSTKQKAKEKLFAITKKIGYPAKWRDYSHVTIAKDKYFENIVSASSNNYQFQLAKLNKPVDKSEWLITPSTVTAYYNPSANEIVFPAAILQPPYFDNNADDALNYGGIGMVIGHEITHAFDDQGAQYDKEGNVKSWWSKDDYAKFKAKTQIVIDQYSTFMVLDTVHVKGAMTVGENAADVGGVAIAYDAFKMTKEGHDTIMVGSYTPDQRFFISVAHIWRVKMKDQFLRLWINNNPHSPPVWRVNGPLMNNPHFYEAFNLHPGDSMYLPSEKRIAIW
ncbi:MAG: M13 family metallopeptidase [Ferruginibacter sp.]